MIGHTRIFDAGRGYGTVTGLREVTDASVTRRGDQWWMFVAGQTTDSDEVQLFSATLPPGAPLSAEGWRITTDTAEPGRPVALAAKERSHQWDGRGGRHCPAYARGFDPARGVWVERIYYAGAPEKPWGPYSIGYLEWDGARWVDAAEPAFTAAEAWERGSVYEPNVVYHDRHWRMWYVAGSNHDDYLVHGYAESADGRSGWSQHRIFAPEAEKIFDFCVLATWRGFEAVFSRVDLSGRGLRPDAGLWWTRADLPSGDRDDWSRPVRIADAGSWKPAFQYSDTSLETMYVFCDSVYPTSAGQGLPFSFTIDCLQLPRPNPR